MIEQLKSMSIEELQSLLDRLELLDSIQAADLLELSPATLRNPKNGYKKISLKLGQYLFWRKGDLKVSHTIRFSYISNYNENGPVRSSGEITIERYGRNGWVWDTAGTAETLSHTARTNEEGNGLWSNGKQVHGTGQFSLPRDPKRALLRLARARANFNTVMDKAEKFSFEFVGEQ